MSPQHSIQRPTCTIKCKYTTNYGTKRCKCYKNEQRCTVYCRISDDHPCINFVPLRERTQASLVRRPTAGAAVGLPVSLSSSPADAEATTSAIASSEVISRVVRRSKRKPAASLAKIDL